MFHIESYHETANNIPKQEKGIFNKICLFNKVLPYLYTART